MSLTWNGLKRADKWCDKQFLPFLLGMACFVGWIVYQLIVWGLR